MVHRLSCSVACGIFPGPGLEPVSPALAGGFLTTAPPDKSHVIYFFNGKVHVERNVLFVKQYIGYFNNYFNFMIN